MFKRFYASVLAVFVCSVTLAVAAPSPWHITAASKVQAVRSKSGIVITANVELANSCYEAAVQKSLLAIYPAQYIVVTRVKPSDVGKFCAMVVVPSVARGSFIMHTVPAKVTVHAKNKAFIVPVETSAG